MHVGEGGEAGDSPRLADGGSRTGSPSFLALDALVAEVRDGDVLGVGGALLTRLPLAALHALADRGPKGLTYATWGGGLPLEILLGAGAVRKVIFCFSSLDIFGLAQGFRAALEEGSVEIEEWPAFAFASRLEAAKQNLPSMPFRVPTGSDLFDRGLVATPAPDSSASVPVALAPRLDLDAFLLHAQRVDEDGNVELYGSRGMDATAVFAARRVLVTTEEIVPRGDLGRLPGSFVVPRHFVHAIAEAPFGAYPTSCLPFYTSDFEELSRVVATSPPPPSPPPDSLRVAHLAGAAALSPGQVRAAVRELVGERGPGAGGEASIDELMVCWLASRLDDESIASAGAVSPLAITSYLLAKATHAPRLAIFMTSGGLLDVALRPMLLGLGEALDTTSAVVRCGGEDSYRWYYQQGRVTCEVVTCAQIDRRARTNNIAVTSPSGRIVRLPGQGGMADVADLHRNFTLYLTRHSPLSLVESVERVSASRSVVGDEARRRAGLEPGRVELLTNLGVFEFEAARAELVRTSQHPGVTHAERSNPTGFDPRVSDELGETALPSPEVLRVLREEIDPLGIRRLEFAPARERGRQLEECIAAEHSLIERALALT